MKFVEITSITGTCGRTGTAPIKAFREIQEPGFVDDRHAYGDCCRKPANGLEIKTTALMLNKQQLDGLQE